MEIVAGSQYRVINPRWPEKYIDKNPLYVIATSGLLTKKRVDQGAYVMMPHSKGEWVETRHIDSDERSLAIASWLVDVSDTRNLAK